MAKLWAYRVTWQDGAPVMRRDEVAAVTRAQVELVPSPSAFIPFSAGMDGGAVTVVLARDDWHQTASAAHAAAIDEVEEQSLVLIDRLLDLHAKKKALLGWEPFEVTTPPTAAEDE